MRTLLLAAALGAVCTFPAFAEEEQNPDAKHKEGQERTERIAIEDELDFEFVKRETRDCVIACFGRSAKKDAKGFAAMAVKLSAAVRKLLPEKEREKPLPGPKITLYVLENGKEEEQFLKAMGKQHNVKEEDLTTFRAGGSWNFFDKPIFVYVQRRTAGAADKSPDGELALHGLAHAFFHRRAEAGYQSTPKWLTEGFAHFIEHEVKPHNPESCVPPGVRGSFDKEKDWANQLKVLAKMGKDTPLTEIAGFKHYDDLSDERCAKAASVVKYLAKTYPEKWWKLANASFALGAEEAFKIVLGKELKTIEGEWRTSITK
ncbi:MAG: hypothetical protein ACYTGX_09920 [Planctomycetota bacterium]|jgi:hypothetical protein